MSFLPNGGTILLFYIILLSLSFSPNSSRRPRLHRLYAKEVARPVFFPFKSVDKLAISSPRILNGGRWRAGEREKSRGISKGLSNFCGEEISLESWHPPLPAQQDHGPPQQILHQILELFRFLFHRICVHPVRPRYAHRSLAHVSDFTCVGFYGRSWRRMFKASKDHCLSRSFEEDQKNLLFGRRIYIYSSPVNEWSPCGANHYLFLYTYIDVSEKEHALLPPFPSPPLLLLLPFLLSPFLDKSFSKRALNTLSRFDANDKEWKRRYFVYRF